MKTTRICARKGCNNEFKLYRTTDKYCSPGCAYEEQKNKQQKPKKQYKLKPFSERRKKESLEYSKKRKIFLSKEENKYCPVAKAIFNETLPTDQVHHMKGRIGKLYLYIPLWLAVSAKGHRWIHDNPEEAYKRGFLIRSTTV